MSKFLTYVLALAIVSALAYTPAWIIYQHVLHGVYAWPALTWVNGFLLYLAGQVLAIKITLTSSQPPA